MEKSKVVLRIPESVYLGKRIGYCNIYITDDIFNNPNPLFVIESTDYTHKYLFTINDITPAGTENGLKPLSKSNCKKVYDHMTKHGCYTRDEFGSIICYLSYWKIMKVFTNEVPKFSTEIKNIPTDNCVNKYMCFNFDCREIIYDCDVLLCGTEYNISIMNDYIYRPILHVRRKGFTNGTMFDLDTLKFYGGIYMKRAHKDALMELLQEDYEEVGCSLRNAIRNEWIALYNNTFKDKYE